MALELGELRSFLVLTEHLHFGRAAQSLHLTQPALTKQIQRLEGKVAGPLFVRGHREVLLTAAGEILRSHAGKLLGEAERIEEMTRLAVNGRAGPLRIGFGIASLGAGLPEILIRFRQQYPHVEISMRDMSTLDQIRALIQGDISVGFVRLPLQHPELGSVPILEERLVAAVSPGIPYRHKLLSLHDQAFVVISRTASASYHDHLVKTCKTAGFAPRIVLEANEIFAVLSLVAAGVGVSLVPHSASKMRVSQVRLMETGLEEAKWQIGLAWRKRDQDDALIRNFVDIARRSA